VSEAEQSLAADGDELNMRLTLIVLLFITLSLAFRQEQVPPNEAHLAKGPVVKIEELVGPTGRFWDTSARLSVVGRLKDTKERGRNRPRFFPAVLKVEGIAQNLRLTHRRTSACSGLPVRSSLIVSFVGEPLKAQRSGAQG
jgi:hypothetical protein